MVEEIYFSAETPLGIVIRTTRIYWEKITNTKHPSIKKYESEVRKTLENPDQIRRSRQDSNVHLYYKSLGKVSICVVADHLDRNQGYIITAYLTDRIKEGEKIYDKN